MKCYAGLAAAIVLTGTSILSVSAKASEAAKADTVSGTIRLQYVKPSDALRSLKDGSESAVETKPFLPPGITEVTPNDRDASIVLSGTTGAVAEMKTILRLFDVRPRRVKVRARLIEMCYYKDGTFREVIRLASTISKNNNQPARVSVGYAAVQGLTLQVTPHINGDNSISVLTELSMRRPANSRNRSTAARVQATQISASRISNDLRIVQGEWKTSRPVSFEVAASPEERAQNGDKSALPYHPMYRVEVSAAELPAAPATGIQP